MRVGWPYLRPVDLLSIIRMIPSGYESWIDITYKSLKMVDCDFFTDFNKELTI